MIGKRFFHSEQISQTRPRAEDERVYETTQQRNHVSCVVSESQSGDGSMKLNSAAA
jgi:conjugal transfer/entry exclusion protein